MIGPLTYLDAALIVIVLISGLVAMYRGFTREVLSIVSWVLAAGACVYFVLNYQKLAEDLAQQFGVPRLVPQVAIGAVIFLIVLVIVHLITARISDTVLDSHVGVIDRILGFFFGVVRGFVVVLIPFMFYLKFVSPDKRSPWVTQAQSRELLEGTSGAVEPMLLWLVERISHRTGTDQQG
jgi:membrane protein required for colicin V production